jgi:hypothetical protein
MLVVMRCGFWPHASLDAAHRPLARHPGLRLVRYDTARPGTRTRDGAGEIPAGDDPAAALVRDLRQAADPEGPGSTAAIAGAVRLEDTP